MNRLIRSCLLVLTAVAVVVPMQAQDVVGGVFPDQQSFIQTNPVTLINVDTPFNQAGQISNAILRFDTFGGASACAASDTFRIRVFRGNVQFGYSLVAERGPFNATKGTVNVLLSPAISERGDLLAVSLSGGTACGIAGTYGSAYRTIYIPSNYTGSVPSSFVDGTDTAYNLRASSSNPSLAGTLPGTGVVAGAAGSSFNTTITMTNPSANVVNLYFAYRAAGSSATPITAPVVVAGRTSKTFTMTDLFPGVSGIGSIDVYSSGANPVVNARVYNDTGNGTNGFTESLVKPTEAAHDRDLLWLTIPSDLTAFRMNIGVRTFGAGATMTCTVYNALGAGQTSIDKTYGPNATSLDALQAFFGGDSRALSPGGSVQCFGSQTVKSDLVLYGTVTDNKTNDSAMFLAERH